jgi:acetyl-CoA acyltransferase
MSQQVQDAYIVSAVRTPVGKIRGVYRTTRPDDLLAHVIRSALDELPHFDRQRIDDVIVGCAMPESEQGLNVARIGLLMAGLPDAVPGVTVNRFCASGLQAVAMAADRIRLGEADIMIAGGTESMTLVPMMGNKVAMNPRLFDGEAHVGIAYGMGITAENVARRWQISREDQDAFGLQSHQRAVAAIDSGEFAEEIAPYTVKSRRPDESEQTVEVTTRKVSVDEGPRHDANAESMARLRPAFAVDGSVTAGNSSQMSDGAGAVVLMSERVVNELALEPVARFVGFAVAGVAPDIMGVGPIEAIPRVLEQTGIRQADLDWIELNEAFAAQSLAVMRELELDPERVNPLGGAIALGHPLGATGAVRTATLLHGLQRRRDRYGMVTMCIGTGMGAAGVFEALHV